jgi:hypothetical protein
LGTLGGYRLQVGSPVIGKGTMILNHGDRDFFGNGIPNRLPSFGVYEPARNK